MDTTSDYLHKHENKEVLDQITQEMINSIFSIDEMIDVVDVSYQKKIDNALETNNKTIVGSINEVNKKIEEFGVEDLDLSNYVSKEELDNKGYLTEHQDLSNYPTKDELSDAIESIDVSEQLENFATKEFVTNEINDKLEESLTNKFDNVEVNETETNDTQTALDFYANGEVVKTVYFSGGGGGNANTPPYITLLSAENNILQLHLVHMLYMHQSPMLFPNYHI